MIAYRGCHTVRELLDAFVDGELPVADQVSVQTHLAALSNPILLDGDGDGAWRSPRELASALLDAHGRDPAALGAALAAHDAAVAIQCAGLWRRRPAVEAGFAASQALCAHAGPHETMLSRLLLEESSPQ